VGQIGDMTLVTFPGEPGTRLAESVLDRIQGEDSDMSFFFVGYGQDYLGYALEEDDWWYGGYEASGSIWGPRQGDYLADQIVATYNQWQGDTSVDASLPRIEPFPYAIETPFVPEEALQRGTPLTQPASEVTVGAVATFTVAGDSPWYGHPVVAVLDAEGNALSRRGGQPWDGSDPSMRMSLEPNPAYTRDDTETQRTFEWTITVPTLAQVEGGVSLDPGSYQIQVTLPTAGDPVVVTSDAFSVVATEEQ